MTKNPIYTIGYGSRSVEELVKLLQQHEILNLIDVRSQPYSRFKPEFSKEALEKQLRQYDIRYVFMGDTLGGRPTDDTCYVDGRVDYARVCEKAFYREGIKRLHSAWKKQIPIALMCSEAKPQDCHRSKLIGNTLIEQHINVAHIDEAGQVKSQEEVNQVLTGGQLSLFGQEPLTSRNRKIGFSRKKYAPRGKR